MSAHYEALQTYLQATIAHHQASDVLKQTRADLKQIEIEFNESEEHARSLLFVGQTIGDIVSYLGNARFVVKSSTGPRYVVGIRESALKELLQRSALQPNDDGESQDQDQGMIPPPSQISYRYSDSPHISSLIEEHTTLNTHQIDKPPAMDPAKLSKLEISRRITSILLNSNIRVALDTTTLTIMKILPPEVNPLIYKMSIEDPGDVSFKDIGGLSNEILEFQEVIQKSLEDPQIFSRIGIKPPKGVLLYGPPGTGKTLLARAMANALNVNFLKVVSSAIIEKYIGESARMIREMFAYAKQNQPCIIFMDEIDAIGSKRSSDSSSSDREVQRTLMELLAQLDGFSELNSVKVIMATNRPDILDDALLRPGRLDRKIEVPLPNDNARREIIKIHARKMNTLRIDKNGDYPENVLQSDQEAADEDSDGLNDVLDKELINLLVSFSSGFNGADLRNLCTEAGLFAIRDDRDFVIKDDFIKAVRKIAASKKLESKIDYKKH